MVMRVPALALYSYNYYRAADRNHLAVLKHFFIVLHTLEKINRSYTFVKGL